MATIKKIKKSQNGSTTKTVDINKNRGVFGPIVVNKAKYDSALNKRRASMDSGMAEYKRKIDSGKAEYKRKINEAKEKIKSSTIKKSQNGSVQNKYVKNLQPMGNSEIVRKRETPSKTVTKFKSEDSNYTQKYTWGKDKTEGPSITQRRTLKGLLSGAPRAAGKLGKLSPMKTGGKTMKKCKYGCK